MQQICREMYHSDTIITLFFSALLILAAAGVADYYQHQRYCTSDGSDVYRHTIGGFYYVDYHTRPREYHVMYFTHRIPTDDLFGEEKDNAFEHDDVVPDSIYALLSLDQVLVTDTPRIDWAHYQQ